MHRDILFERSSGSNLVQPSTQSRANLNPIAQALSCQVWCIGKDGESQPGLATVFDYPHCDLVCCFFFFNNMGIDIDENEQGMCSANVR